MFALGLIFASCDTDLFTESNSEGPYNHKITESQKVGVQYMAVYPDLS